MEQSAHNGQQSQKRPPAVSTGNPRVTVAFPFSKIEITEPPSGLGDLAAVVSRLAGEVARIAHAASPATAEAADALADEATALALRLGAS
jgi:hypothetical protein